MRGEASCAIGTKSLRGVRREASGVRAQRSCAPVGFDGTRSRGDTPRAAQKAGDTAAMEQERARRRLGRDATQRKDGEGWVSMVGKNVMQWACIALRRCWSEVPARNRRARDPSPPTHPPAFSLVAFSLSPNGVYTSRTNQGDVGHPDHPAAPKRPPKTPHETVQGSPPSGVAAKPRVPPPTSRTSSHLDARVAP
jgi:hypothetical protein